MQKIDRKECHEQFGLFVRRARRNLKLTQGDVAEMIGVSTSYLCRMENGEREIDLPIALKLCDVLDLKIEDFINRYM